MKNLKVVFTLIFVQGILGIAYAAPSDCRTASLPDGTPALFCKDKKGNWKQQAGKVDVAAVAKASDEIPVKAGAVYQGTYEYVEKIPPKKRRTRGLADIINSRIDDALNTQTYKSTAGFTMTLQFNGTLVTGSDKGNEDWGVNSYTGFVRNGVCELNTSRGNSYGLLKGPCGPQGFSGTITGRTLGGNNFTGKFEMIAVKYEDTSQRDAQRALLKAKCDGGSASACVELDQYK